MNPWWLLTPEARERWLSEQPKEEHGFVMVDELAQFTEEQYEEIAKRVRLRPIRVVRGGK